MAVPWGLRSLAEKSGHRTRPPRWVLLGSDKGKGLYRASWDPATGVMGPAELAVEIVHPTYFAAHPDLPLLYAVEEGEGERAALCVLGIDAKHGTAKVLDRAPSHGDGPCYVAINDDGTLVLVANYTGGSVAAIPIDEYGLPGISRPGVPVVSVGSIYQPETRFIRRTPAPNSFHCKESEVCGPLGPNKDRQDAPHLHCAIFAPGDHYALVCDLGDDAILVFGPRLESTGELRTPVRVAARPGSGPRHVTFHPNEKWVYCINELDCTVELYDWEKGEAGAKLSRRDGSAVSTLRPGASPAGDTAAEITIGDDGRFVYTCTRGENSLTVYAIDPPTGLLHEQQRVSCGGAVPRYIGFDPSRQWLLCTNQGSSTVTVFAHDVATGRLSETPKTFPAESPMCVAFA